MIFKIGIFQICLCDCQADGQQETGQESLQGFCAILKFVLFSTIHIQECLINVTNLGDKEGLKAQGFCQEWPERCAGGD